MLHRDRHHSRAALGRHSTHPDPSSARRKASSSAAVVAAATAAATASAAAAAAAPPASAAAAAAPPDPAPERRSFPRKPGRTAPLTSIDDLMRWRPTGLAARCVSSVPLSESAVRRFVRGTADRPTAAHPPAHALPALPAPPSAAAKDSPVLARGAAGSLKRLQPPRLLVCHDFRDAYQPWEACATGAFGDDCPPDMDMWRFNHWAYVDVFVYFSHYRVTIPPVGYIHAAHRHGALALGTLIFEWQEGAADLQKILVSYKTRAKAATQLAAIAKFYGFDGWLVNVEVALLGGSAAASDLASFVGDLTRSTRKAVGPASEVVWYDSVTRDGSLKWQNELNAENEQFFKAAGSLFTNYHWDRNAPVRSAVKAATRRTDVFTGIDVHGRNTFGGGGFHTHIALRAIKQGGTSAAIFAPAWTVEKCPPNVTDPRELEERFWTGPSARFGRECVAQYFRERAVITDLPFFTTFDPGWGDRLMRNGNVKDNRRYFNMAQQSVQPSFMRTVVAAGDTASSELVMSQEEAYNGSTSVKVTFTFSESRMLTGSFSVLRLFMASLAFPARLSSRITKSHVGSLRVSYNYLASSDTDVNSAADDFGVALLMSAPPMVVLLVGSNSRWNMSATARRAMPRMQILGKFVDVEVVVADSDRRALGAPVAPEGSTGWMTRSFVLPGALTSAQRLAELLVIVGRPPEQPVSVRPSPFMTPSGGTRPGSRVGSRMASTTTSRLGSRDVSRSGSPPRGGAGERRRVGGGLPTNTDAGYGEMEEATPRDGATDEASEHGRQDAFGGALLNQFRESFGARRLAYNRPPTADVEHGGPGSSFDRSRHGAAGLGRSMDGDDGAPDVHPHVDLAAIRARLGSRTRGRSGAHGGVVLEGEMDFSRLEMEDNVAAGHYSRFGSQVATPIGSRPVSRFGSRLNSVAGSRSGSLAHSLAGSRAGSIANSRLGSRAASRQGSRFVSPSRTPITGGGGAAALDAKARDAAVAGDKPGIMSPGFRSREGSGLGNTASATGSRNSAALTDLKHALMHAAGSMAGEVGGGQDSARGGGVRTVYLGGVKLELVNEDEDAGGGPLRTSTSAASLTSAGSGNAMGAQHRLAAFGEHLGVSTAESRAH